MILGERFVIEEGVFRHEFFHGSLSDFESILGGEHGYGSSRADDEDLFGFFFVHIFDHISVVRVGGFLVEY